jgi:hypothetical protein
MEVDMQLERRFGLTSLGGATMVLLGVFYLLMTLGIGAIDNWWAIFILLPGLAFLGIAQAASQRANGRFNAIARFNVSMGVILLAVAGIFYVNLDWTTWWPIMVMASGAALFINGLTRPETTQSGVTAVASMTRWIGVTVGLLGLTFLVDQLGLIDLEAHFGNLGWWGIFITLPGIGAFITTARLYHWNGNRFSLGAMGLAVTGVLILCTAVIEFLRLSWGSFDALIGITFIVSGFLFLISGRRR